MFQRLGQQLAGEVVGGEVDDAVGLCQRVGKAVAEINGGADFDALILGGGEHGLAHAAFASGDEEFERGHKSGMVRLAPAHRFGNR